MPQTISSAIISPVQSMELLSQMEMASLANTDEGVHALFRRCALAILNTGSATDNAHAIFDAYETFDIRVLPEPWGLQLEVLNAPAQAFVDGRMLQAIRSHLFAALRDIVYVHHKLVNQRRFDFESGEGITDAVFRILRNAGIVRSDVPPRLVVCWGGHSIPRDEYEYTKEVGYELGLRELDISTGCGPGAMKGPMKGAAIGHAKQFYKAGRFVGVTEPDIIAAEPPNPLVNELVIMPDIEKRLEAFVRLAHAVVVFPGGVGTLEEILYILGVKSHPDNAGQPLPLFLAAADAQADYLATIDQFLRKVLGDGIAEHYQLVVGNPSEVARQVRHAVDAVREHRVRTRESFSFNWGLWIEEGLQRPFHPTHASMAELNLHTEQPLHVLIAELRRAFSGITAGNVKDFGVRAVLRHGPFQLHGDADIIGQLGPLLQMLVSQGRMRLDVRDYVPCFELAGS
ncbi:MAG: nucleotide 5'-monophosphate nucleosidase PpnN [Halioglobus sp.]